MRTTNEFFIYSFLFLMSCLFFYGTSCRTSRQVKEVAGDYDRHPVFGKSLLSESWQEPKLTEIKRISHAYSFSKDTFVITLIDMDKNKSFVNSEDIVVVSSLKDSVAPIIPSVNNNAAFFRPELGFEFYGIKYKLSDVSSDGKQISINKIQSNRDLQIQAIFTDQISNDLWISEIRSNNSYNLLETIQAQNKEYILIYFWLPNCPPCYENIPMLKKFEDNGIGIINLFFMRNDEVELVEKQISRFAIPGINFRSSPELIKYFSQNGFPFSVLIDASSNKILSSSHRMADQEKHINF